MVSERKLLQSLRNWQNNIKASLPGRAAMAEQRHAWKKS